MMKLDDLGYSDDFESYRKEQGLDSFEVGRVISEHKDRYIVKSAEKESSGEIVGNLRYTANSKSDFPAVGDWVAISEYDEGKVLIHAVFKRKTILERQAVGKQGEKQIIAANVDYAFIVQAVDRDFNINRMERYLAICHTSDVSPIIVLNKIDLIGDTELTKIVANIKDRIKQVPVITVSNETFAGFEKIKDCITKGKTYCLLGSSGVGKSTLLNNLSGRQLMKTNAISSSTNRGRHVTTHRELIVLENGGILIDNPGMREIGIADSSDGIETTFEIISELSRECKFSDCTHTVEKGCAIQLAIESGEIDEASYENFLKLEREKEHYESTVAERRKKGKALAKMVKEAVRFKNKL
jgi:ribosome biogenesis GTPase